MAKKRPVRVQPAVQRTTPEVRSGRKQLVRNARVRSMCKRMAEHGITQKDAAEIIGISESTLKSRLGDEFKDGLENYNGAVVNNLRRHALGDGPSAVTACIYWTKVQLGWSEKLRLEVSFGPVIERMVAGFLDILHAAIPDFCPGCRTALNLKPELARVLLAESAKLTGAAAAPDIMQTRGGV